MTYIWQQALEVASEEARQSGLPGLNNGPGDAVRHIVGAAEMRRRGGAWYAWTILQVNERDGTHMRGQPADLAAMDDVNNAIGLAIGGRAQSYAEVVSMAREAVRRGIEAGGTGADGTPVWAAPSRWNLENGFRDRHGGADMEWLDRKPGGGTYAFGSPDYTFLRGLTGTEAEQARLSDLARVPPGAWTEDDVRGVIRSRPYQDGRHPQHAEWQQRVRSFYEARQREAERQEEMRRTEEASHVNAPDTELLPKIAEEDGGGGVVRVRAYTRDGENGPVHVSSHERSAPHP